MSFGLMGVFLLTVEKPSDILYLCSPSFPLTFHSSFHSFLPPQALREAPMRLMQTLTRYVSRMALSMNSKGLSLGQDQGEGLQRSASTRLRVESFKVSRMEV